MADRRQREEELEQLSAYLDGELSERERAGVERLIAQDPRAARLLNELRRTSHLLRSLPRAAASADLAAHIADRMEREALLGDANALGGESRRPLGWMKPLSLAAGFVLIVTAGWLLWPQVHERQKADSSVTVVQAPPVAPAPSGITGSTPKDSALKFGAAESASEQDAPMAARIASRSEEGLNKKERSDVAPMALAPRAAGRSLARSDEMSDRGIFDAGLGGAVARQIEPRRPTTTTSAPTSAPTTTSAPATAQPTTRSNTGG